MERKLKKSVVATGLAATTIISSGLAHQVNAEELQKDTIEATSAKVMTKPVTEADVQSAKVQTDVAKVQVETQEKIVEQAKEETAAAEAEITQAEKNVATAQQEKEAATPEAIQQAQEEVSEAKQEVSQEEAAVVEADKAVESAKEDIAKQENIITAQQSLVDVAQHELDQAKKPVEREEKELQQAQAEAEQAAKNVVTKEATFNQLNEEVAALPKEIENAQAQIAQSEQKIAETQQAIQEKSAELARVEQESPQKQQVDLKTATYQEFLQDLQQNGENAAIKQAAAEALAIYGKAQREDGITVGNDVRSPATLENNLKAIELIKAINRYRKEAGLPELVVDPYKAPASQVQTLYFEKEKWHMGKYIGNENIAISFDPQGAVNFWHSEKALYQQLAPQYGLSTDERQLDANAIYMKVGASVFARIGHYIQMMDNKANAITAAYDTVPNAYSTTRGTSQAGFLHISNLNERLANGTLVRVEDYEQMIRGYGVTTKVNTEKIAALRQELGLLEAQQTGNRSNLEIQRQRLSELQALTTNKSAALATANAEKITAQALAQKTSETVAEKKAALAREVSKIADQVKPKEEAVQKAQELLQNAKDRLAELQLALEAAQARVLQSQDAVKASQLRLQTKQKQVEDLKNAPHAVLEAQKMLQTTQMKHAAKVAVLKEEELKLTMYRSVHKKLQTQYEQLKTQLPVKKPAVGQDLSFTNKETSPFNPLLSDNKKNTSTTKGEPVPTSQSAKTLPKTGTEMDHLAALGAMLGVAGLANVHRRKKKSEK